MTSQPTVPGYTPRDDEDLDPAPTPPRRKRAWRFKAPR